MLDAQELAKRLRIAMDLRDRPIHSVELAAKMGVTKQAIYEWRTTGRIGKGRLLDLAAATGMPVEFYLEPERGLSGVTKAIWRKLGRAFAKVAVLLLFAIPPLMPSPAQAEFNITFNSLCIALRFRRFWGWPWKMLHA